MLQNETRKRLVEGYTRTHDAEGIAAAYGVSVRQVYRLCKQQRETGSVDLKTSQRGRKPKLSAEQLRQVDELLQKEPDITLQEVIDKLHLNISDSRLGRIVRENLGYSRKKKMVHASEQERPRCRKKAH